MHLLADEREFEGVGQTDLMRGACWVGPLRESVHDAANLITHHDLLIGSTTIGLILALLALGVYLSFRIFNFPDITADGSITFGASVTATFLVHHWSPWLATLAGFAAGTIAGATPALLHTKFKINGLLSGILVMTALYSVNLHVMGKSNVPLLNETTLASQAESLGCRVFRSPTAISMSSAGQWACAMPPCCWRCWASSASSALALYLFFRTNLGTAMRATGDNPQMIRALGVSVDFILILGLALSNGLIALAARCWRSIRDSPTSRWASAWWYGDWPA